MPLPSEFSWRRTTGCSLPLDYTPMVSLGLAVLQLIWTSSGMRMAKYSLFVETKNRDAF